MTSHLPIPLGVLGRRCTPSFRGPRAGQGAGPSPLSRAVHTICGARPAIVWGTRQNSRALPAFCVGPLRSRGQSLLPAGFPAFRRAIPLWRTSPALAWRPSRSHVTPLAFGGRPRDGRSVRMRTAPVRWHRGRSLGERTIGRTIGRRSPGPDDRGVRRGRRPRSGRVLRPRTRCAGPPRRSHRGRSCVRTGSSGRAASARRPA